MRRSPERQSENQHPRWHRWLNRLPAPFYLLAAVLTAGAIAWFVISLDEKSLALVACGAFAGLLFWFSRSAYLDWQDAERSERVISVVICVFLLAALAANAVRFMLLN